MVKGTYERKISVRRILIAFLLTSGVFLIGLLVGSTLTSERSQYLESIASQQRLDYNSLQLQELYLNTQSNNASCLTIRRILQDSLNLVADAQLKVDRYILESSEKNYMEIKRDYTLAQIRYWLLDQKIKESCKSEEVSILYFYSNEGCNECGPQGTILSYLKQKLGDKLLVFSLDADFTEEPMVGIMKQTYNITSIPSIVIENQVFNKLVTRDQLLNMICSHYSEKPEIC